MGWKEFCWAFCCPREPVAVHVYAWCDRGTACARRASLCSHVYTRVGPAPVTCPAPGRDCRVLISALLWVCSWQNLQSTDFNPALGLHLGTSPSSVHSHDVFCSHRNQGALEGGKAEGEWEKQKNEADQKCAVGIDGSGCGDLQQLSKAWRQWAALFNCGYVIQE